MEKKPFVTLEQVKEMAASYPTPFHLYDEKGIRENARKLKAAFAWNPNFHEYFAVKATPNPYIMDILKSEGGVAFTAKYSWKFGFHANAAFSFLAFSRIPFSSYR